VTVKEMVYRVSPVALRKGGNRAVMVTTTLTDDPVLVRFREALDEVYGTQNIERVVLFGSRARGDARPDSDYDIAVFLNEPGELWEDLGKLSHITTAILNDTDAVISAKPFPAGAWRELSPLMHEIRDDGIEL
jgi:predicted nucleotidyltransferase